MDLSGVVGDDDLKNVAGVIEAYVRSQAGKSCFLTLPNYTDGCWQLGKCLHKLEGDIHLDCPSVLRVDANAFAKCTSLTTVTMSMVSSLSDFAFAECSSLTIATMPNLEHVSNSAFYKCVALTTVGIPKTKTIWNDVFFGCTALTAVDLPDARTIWDRAFADCKSLAIVAVPKATHITKFAFAGCQNLVYLDVRNVDFVNANAFQSCARIKTLACPPRRVAGIMFHAAGPVTVAMDVGHRADVAGWTSKRVKVNLETAVRDGIVDRDRVLSFFLATGSRSDGHTPLPNEIKLHVANNMLPAVYNKHGVFFEYTRKTPPSP